MKYLLGSSFSTMSQKMSGPFSSLGDISSASVSRWKLPIIVLLVGIWYLSLSCWRPDSDKGKKLSASIQYGST